MQRAYISQWKSLFVCCWLLLQLYFFLSLFCLQLFIWGTRVLHTQSVAWNKYFTLLGEPFCVSGDEASERSNTHWKLNWSWDVSEKWRLKSTTITDSLRSHRKKHNKLFLFSNSQTPFEFTEIFFTLLFFFLRPFSKCLASPYKYTVHYFLEFQTLFFLPSLAHFNMLYLFSTLYEEQLLARDKLFKLSSSIRLGSE